MSDQSASDDRESPAFRPPGHDGVDPAPRRPDDPLREQYRNPTYAAPPAPPAPRIPAPRAHGATSRTIRPPSSGRRWLDRVWRLDAKMRPFTERIKPLPRIFTNMRLIIALVFLLIAVLGYLFDPRTGLFWR